MTMIINHTLPVSVIFQYFLSPLQEKTDWCIIYKIMMYTVQQITTVCLKKNTLDIFSCNLNKYFPISIIFGTSIT